LGAATVCTHGGLEARAFGLSAIEVDTASLA
jgi:hypothetical protein